MQWKSRITRKIHGSEGHELIELMRGNGGRVSVDTISVLEYQLPVSAQSSTCSYNAGYMGCKYGVHTYIIFGKAWYMGHLAFLS